ncbi:MAG: hypothetical protein ACMUIL_10405 [bacterium]
MIVEALYFAYAKILNKRQTLMPLCGATKHENSVLFSEQTLMPFQGATKNENAIFSDEYRIFLRQRDNLS